MSVPIVGLTIQERVRRALTYIPGFPNGDFNFPDITPVLERDPALFREIIRKLLQATEDWSFDTVLCVESFGYVFGVPLAYERGCKIALMRRSGKLPRATHKYSYSMCYQDNRCMEIHKTALRRGDRVLVVDDFLVSGGTAAAALELIRQASAVAAGIACIIEKTSWNPRDALARYSVPIFTLTTIS